MIRRWFIGGVAVPTARSGWTTAGQWWAIPEPGQLLEVLNSGGQEKLIRGAGNPRQPQPSKAQIPLQMSERNFDLAPFPGGPLEGLGFLKGANMLAFGFEQIARDDPLCSFGAARLQAQARQSLALAQ
jgi:hypothetical protein